MRRRLILFACVALGVLVLGASWPTVPKLVRVEFTGGTTLEEAANALESVDGLDVPTSFIWGHQIGFRAWSGGVRYRPGQDVTPLRNAHWQKNYYSHLLRDIRDSESDLSGSALSVTARSNVERLLELSTQAKVEWDTTYGECWNMDSCPAIPLHSTEIEIAAQQVVTDLLNLDTVQSVVELETDSFFFDSFRDW
ncbi:MAG: hypothetical protein AAF702_04830 [Chloroflexota bacterium]